MCLSEWAPHSHCGVLLEDVVDQDLKEDEENDDDAVALLQERAALCPARRATPQHADAPANTRGGGGELRGGPVVITRSWCGATCAFLTCLCPPASAL